jgi:branched-chain amino acid transport system substrate-binding protein
MKRIPLSRRKFITVSSVATVGAALAACAPPPAAAPAAPAAPAQSTGKKIRIGYITPQTGPLAPFGEADAFVTGEMVKFFANGLKIGNDSYAVEVLVKDSQSDPNKAAESASSLISKDGVDLVLASSTPETTNPVSDQCEANGMPCITTVAPWQPWVLRSNTDTPAKAYKSSYHFFWGLEDIIGVFLEMWGSVETNKVVGGMWPNDGDGLAWSSPVGFPPALEKAGYKVIDAGRYNNAKDDFTAEISLFKKEGVEIVTGVMIPPDLGTFMTQSAQQGFKPKMMTVGKAALFPGVIQSIPNNLGDGITSEIWWTPNHPFKSSLTGQSAKELADAFTAATQKQWTQPIGFVHALFEVAADALKRSSNPNDKAALVNAIKATKLDTVVGNLDWSKGPNPNVAKTQLVGGQWVKGTANPFDLVITNNAAAGNIPSAGKVSPMKWGS